MDPVAAAGAKAIAEATTSVAKTGIVQALLLPIAKVYGEHWAKEAKEKIAIAVEVKKQKNLAAHLAGANFAGQTDLDPDPALLKIWIDGVENVDPVDTDLSAA